MSTYENGKVVPETKLLVKMAEVLEVSTDYLMEGATDEVAKSYLKDRELLRQFQQVEKLNDEDKNIVKVFLDAFITKKYLNELISPKEDKIPA